jgi:hypothetical protein
MFPADAQPSQSLGVMVLKSRLVRGGWEKGHCEVEGKPMTWACETRSIMVYQLYLPCQVA